MELQGGTLESNSAGTTPTVAFTVEASDFVLGRALAVPADGVATAEPAVAGDGLPSLLVLERAEQVAGPDLVGDRSLVDGATLLDSDGERHRYLVEWDCERGPLLDAIDEANGVVRSLGGDDAWSFAVEFPSDEAVSAFDADCRRADVQIRIDRFVRGRDHQERAGLSDPQKEVLEHAHRLGYFEVPREATLEDVADELGITDSAVSERLRRALGSLVESTV